MREQKDKTEPSFDNFASLALASDNLALSTLFLVLYCLDIISSQWLWSRTTPPQSSLEYERREPLSCISNWSEGRTRRAKFNVFVSHDRALCSSEWRAGGYRRGRRAGDTIGSWLGHSIICLGPHSLWVGARSASRSKMRGACLRASSRRVGPPEAG